MSLFYRRYSLHRCIALSEAIFSKREIKALSVAPSACLDLLKSKFEVLSEDMSYYQLSTIQKLTASLSFIVRQFTSLLKRPSPPFQGGLEPKIFIDIPNFEKCLIYLASKEHEALVIELLCLYPMKLTDSCFDVLLQLSRKAGNMLLESYLIENHINSNVRVKAFALMAASFGDIQSLTKIKDKYEFDYLSIAEPLLAEAAANNHFKLVNHLLESGALSEDSLYIGLIASAQNNQLEMVKFFQNIGVVVTTKNNAAVIHAAESGHLKMVAYLERQGADIQDNNEEALSRAVSNGQKEMVEYLFSKGVDATPDYLARMSLAMANCAANGHIGMLKYLVSLGFSFKDSDASRILSRVILHKVAGNNDIQMYEYLLSEDLGLEIDYDGNSLRAAIRSGYLQMVQYLISKDKLQLNDLNSYLLEAVGCGHIGMVKYLQSLGADVHASSFEALSFAASDGHLQMLKYLQYQGLKFNLSNCEAMIAAVRHGHLDIVKYLVSQGINPNTGNGYSLIEAVQKQKIEIVQYFMKLGIFRSLMNYTEILKVFAASENVQFKKICSEELEVLGFNKVNPYLSPSQYQEAVDESIALGPIPYKTAGGEVFRAIRAENHLKALRRSVYLNLIGSETSMDTSLMKAARYHFDNVIFKDTDLENRVVKSGGVDGVESIIKALLLERLKSIPVLNAFLTPKKMSAILAGDYAERKALLSRIQSNNEDIVAIVYRAYESLAKTTDWPNLFTAPSAADANNSVFATVSSLAQRQRGVVVVQSMGSDEIRKMSAYIFLLALRELEKGDDTVLQNWFFYVAEIRRAHNQNSKGIDNPSCYPGCVTRLAQALKSTALKVPVNFHQEVNEYIRQAMIKAFSSHLATLQTKEEKIKFYDAITALHFDYDETFRNDAVLKIIDKSMVLSDGEEWVDSEYLPIRAAFIREYFGNLEEALSTMLQSISHSGIVIPHESQYEVIAMIEKAFIEITHLGAICSMNAAMIKSLGLNNEPTFSLIQNPYFFYDDFESCLGKFNQNIVVAKHAYLENNLKFTLFNKVKGFFSSVEEAQFYVTELYFRVKSGFEMKGKSFDIKHIEEIRLAMEALVDNDEDLRLVSSKAYSYLPRGATRLSGVQVDHHASNPNNGHEPSKQNVKKKKKANNQKKRRRF